MELNKIILYVCITLSSFTLKAQNCKFEKEFHRISFENDSTISNYQEMTFELNNLLEVYFQRVNDYEELGYLLKVDSNLLYTFTPIVGGAAVCTFSGVLDQSTIDVIYSTKGNIGYYESLCSLQNVFSSLEFLILNSDTGLTELLALDGDLNSALNDNSENFKKSYLCYQLIQDLIERHNQKKL